MPDDIEGKGNEPDDMSEPPSFFPWRESDSAPTGHFLGEPVEVQVEGVLQSNVTGKFFVQVGDGERQVTMVIGQPEAIGIAMQLKRQSPEGESSDGTGHPTRPTVYDLFHTVLERLEGTLNKVVVDDLYEGTYYAKLYIKQGADELIIDARPSDAIALALRFECPIYVADGILESGGEE